MINKLKQKWRAIHISKDVIKIGSKYRLNKRVLDFVDVSKRVPNMVILGAQKCGTTSLYHYLSKHPDIAVTSPLKEPGYFVFDNELINYWKDRGICIKSKQELKLKHMSDKLYKQKYFCDASTYYTQEFYQNKKDIAEQIKLDCPDVKMIYIIRNPFERITSIYYHMKRRRVKEDFRLNKIDDIVSWGTNFVETSLYYNRIKTFYKLFKKNQILVIQLENLKQDLEGELNKVFDFLELEPITIKNNSIHNKTSPDILDKFSLPTYNKILPLFEKQRELLESNLGVIVDWDFDRERWVDKYKE